jgi:hypothetical protein
LKGTPEAKLTIKQKEAQTTEMTNLRKEFNNLPEVKQFKSVKTMYDNVKSSADKKSAAGDMSLIFAYMKILDPTSTVRE